MGYSRKKNIISLCINAFIVINTFYISLTGIVGGASDGQVGNAMGYSYFSAFTMDSNILMGFVSFMMLCFDMNSLVNRKNEYPRWAVSVYLAGTVAVSLTFFVVLLFLAPMFQIMGSGWATMYNHYDMFFFHFLHPILADITFIFLIPYHVMERKNNICSIIPMVLYSIYYIVTVIFLKTMSDIYNFTFGGHLAIAPVSAAVIYISTFLISLGIGKLHNKNVMRNSAGV